MLRDMKRAILVLVLAAVLAPVASAEPLPGFRESVRLSPRASTIVGKPVRVYCAGSLELWTDTVIGKGWVGGVEGFAPYDRSGAYLGEAYLAPWVCQPLERWLRGKSVPMSNLAIGIRALIHESIHLRGVHDEEAASCGSVREAAKWARALFGVKRTVALRQVVAVARATTPC